MGRLRFKLLHNQPSISTPSATSRRGKLGSLNHWPVDPDWLARDRSGYPAGGYTVGEAEAARELTFPSTRVAYQAASAHERRGGPMAEAVGAIRIAGAPVITFGAALVAERLGFDREAAFTPRQAMAGLSAYAKDVALGAPAPRLAAGRFAGWACCTGPWVGWRG
jgi:hypothetical protein